MEFDADTLEPLYRLRIGEAGHSYAFVIARSWSRSLPDRGKSQKRVWQEITRPLSKR